MRRSFLISINVIIILFYIWPEEVGTERLEQTGCDQYMKCL